MTERTPTRFRRRLTAAFVLVAAATAGLLAVIAVALSTEYRWRTVREQSTEEARVALALAPVDLDAERFERLRVEYETRTEADILARGPSGTFTSSPDIGVLDVPTSLRGDLSTDLRSVSTEVDGRSFLVVGASLDQDTDYWFFFSLAQLEDSLSDFRRSCAVAWAGTTLLAGAVGRMVARRTLRPVGRAAAAAEAIADGRRATRLPTGSDEFGALATSFNRMADEVQQTIHRLEQAAERERTFTADVAHDLRTPLTGLAASASLLTDQLHNLPPSAQRPAELVAADVERLRVLVLELLELSQLDAGVEEVHLTRLDVGQAFRAAVQSLGSSLVLDLDLEPHAAAVLAEPRRLGRILANVLSNAATHGGGHATMSARREENLVHIDLVDDGPGIPDDALPTIFDRFAKSDRARAGTGSGLGLAIARGHALAQGGDLRASNVPGRGAQFTLTLQAAPEPDDADQIDAVTASANSRH